ncbi:hypothetical protein CR513_40253, partial [Mucuna pruriens]
MLKELATPNVVYQPWCEDSYKHLKKFHVVCSTMRPQGIPEDYIKMKAFPFSLDGVVKDWFSSRPPKRILSEKKSVESDSKQEKHYTNTRSGSIACISEQLLIQYFYEGLMLMDRSMIDVASGGALMDKTPAVARP